MSWRAGFSCSAAMMDGSPAISRVRTPLPMMTARGFAGVGEARLRMHHDAVHRGHARCGAAQRHAPAGLLDAVEQPQRDQRVEFVEAARK